MNDKRNTEPIPLKKKKIDPLDEAADEESLGPVDEDDAVETTVGVAMPRILDDLEEKTFKKGKKKKK